MSNIESVFRTAATRVLSVASRATRGPYLMSKTVPTALRCADDVDGSERHLAYGIARKEDFRLLVGSDPRTFELIAEVFAAASPTDAAAPALTDLAAHLSAKMGLSLPEADFGIDGLEEMESAFAADPHSDDAPAAPVPVEPAPARVEPAAVIPTLDAADL